MPTGSVERNSHSTNARKQVNKCELLINDFPLFFSHIRNIAGYRFSDTILNSLIRCSRITVQFFIQFIFNPYMHLFHIHSPLGII